MHVLCIMIIIINRVDAVKMKGTQSRRALLNNNHLYFKPQDVRSFAHRDMPSNRSLPVFSPRRHW